MVKVPDTTTFALSDVPPAIIVISKGTISSVTNNGGTARFNTSSTGYLAVNDWVTITNTTYYNGYWQVTAVLANTWFETTRPYIQPDSGLWEKELLSLGDCFDDSAASRFDPRYEGAQDRLSNFRNYGPTGWLTNIDNEDNGGLYNGIHGDGYWFFCTSGDYGVRCYDVTTGGLLVLNDTEDAPGNEHFDDLWVQDFLVFLTSVDSVAGKNYLRTYTYNTSTGIMAIGDVIQSSSDLGTHNVFGDGTDLIFVVQPTGATSYGIHSFKYDVVGNLQYKVAYTADSARYYKGVYQGGYLFVVGDNGITSFTRNTTTGVLTKIDNDNTGTFVGNSIIYDSENDVLIIGSQADGPIVYSHSSGILTQEYIGGSGAVAFPAYHPDANYLYFQEPGSGDIRRYRFNQNKDLEYIGEQALAISNKLYIWDLAENIVIATDGYDGIRTYLIDYD